VLIIIYPFVGFTHPELSNAISVEEKITFLYLILFFSFDFFYHYINFELKLLSILLFIKIFFGFYLFELL